MVLDIVSHFAESLKITVKQANYFISCTEKDSRGNKKDGSWKSIPKPLAAKIDLTRNKDNLLNLHYLLSVWAQLINKFWSNI